MFTIEENKKKEILIIFSEDIEKLKPIISTYFGLFLEVIFTLVIGFIISMIFDWKIALLAFLFFICLFFIAYILYTYQIKYKEDKFSNRFFSDTIKNIKLVMSCNLKENIINFLIKRDKIDLSTKNSFIKDLVYFIIIGVNLCIIYTLFGLIIYIAGIFVIKENKSTLNTFIGSSYFLFLVLIFIYVLIKYLYEFSSIKDTFKKLNYLFYKKFNNNTIKNTHIRLYDETNFLDIDDLNEKIRGKIEFKNVSFIYPGKKKVKVLDNISFKILPGTKIGFVGLSGSGKSTILQLLLRFYEPNEGEILLDDINIKNYDLTLLRDYISGVFQDPDLFECSIIDNIRYGKLNATGVEIDEVVDISCVPKSLIEEYNTQKISELSPGEKQKIAIARCLLKDRKIMFFDEATSALDANTDYHINQNLRIYFNSKEKKTILIVAHR